MAKKNKDDEPLNIKDIRKDDKTLDKLAGGGKPKKGDVLEEKIGEFVKEVNEPSESEKRIKEALRQSGLDKDK